MFQSGMGLRRSKSIRLTFYLVFLLFTLNLRLDLHNKSRFIEKIIYYVVTALLLECKNTIRACFPNSFINIRFTFVNYLNVMTIDSENRSTSFSIIVIYRTFNNYLLCTTLAFRRYNYAMLTVGQYLSVNAMFRN